MIFFNPTETKEYVLNTHGINKYYLFANSYKNYDWLSPENLLINISQNKKIKNTKELKLFLEKTFSQSGFKLKDHYAIAVEFETEIFVIWANATGKGWHIETKCQNNNRHSRFCIKILQKCNFKYDSKHLGVSNNTSLEPQSIGLYLNENNEIKDNYFEDLQIGQDEFLKKITKTKGVFNV